MGFAECHWYTGEKQEKAKSKSSLMEDEVWKS